MYIIRIIIAIILVSSLESRATNLKESLEQLYNSSNIKSLQDNLKAEHETYYQVIANNWLPKVNLNYSTGKKGTWDQGQKSYMNKNVTQQLVLTQPILNSGNSILEVKMSKLTMEILHQEYIYNEQELFFQGIATYYNLIRTKKLLEAAEIAEKSLQNHYSSSQERIKLGEITKTNLALSKARYEDSKAEKASSLANYRAAQNYFENLFGFIPEDELLIEKDILHADLDSEIMKNQIFNNPQLRSAKLKTQLTNLDTKSPLTTFVPKASLNMFAGKVKKNYAKNSFANESKGWSIDLSLPIFNSGIDISNYRKKANKNLAELSNYNNILKDVSTQLISEIDKYSALSVGLGAAEESVKASSMALEATKDEFKLGSKTILSVLDRENELYQEKVKQTNKLYEYILCQFKIQKLLGQLSSKALNLNVEHFDYNKHLDKTKLKLFSLK